MEKVKLYSPGNAANLTDEDIAAMQELSLEEIKALAEAYPNKPSTTTSYLVLRDKNKADKDQLFSRSTWTNLYELRKQGLHNYVAMGFSSNYHKALGKKEAPVGKAQDLTQDDVLKAEGIKRTTGTTEKVQEQNLSQDSGLGDTSSIPRGTGKTKTPDTAASKEAATKTATKAATKASTKQAAPKKAASKKGSNK